MSPHSPPQPPAYSPQNPPTAATPGVRAGHGGDRGNGGGGGLGPVNPEAGVHLALTSGPAAVGPDGQPASWLGQNQMVFDFTGLDPRRCQFDRAAIGLMNPHRHEMALLDRIVWTSDDFTRAVAAWNVRPDEFWVRGHFPKKALVPGVLQIEAGAQLAAFVYNKREPQPRLCAFTRIDHCSFRAQVQPGDELIILCREIKRRSRQFISAIQGWVNGKMAYEAEIEGLRIGESIE